MKRSSLAIVLSLTAIMTAPLVAQAGGNPVKDSGYQKNKQSQPVKPTVPVSYTNNNPSSATAGAAAVSGAYSKSGANASTGDQSVDLKNSNNIHNSNSNSANGGAGGNSDVKLNNQNDNSNSNTNNVQGGAGGSSYNANEAYGGNAQGGTGIGIGKGGQGGQGGQGGKGGQGGSANAQNTNSNHLNSQGGNGYGGTAYGGSGNYTTTTIGGNSYNEATQAPQLGAPHAVPGNAGFSYNSYVCNNLQTSVAVSAGNKTSSTSGGFNIIGFGIGGGNSNSDISIPKEYAAGLRTIPLQIAAGTLGAMSTLDVSDTTPAWFASMILRMSADPADAKQVAKYNQIADQMQGIKTNRIHCPSFQAAPVVTIDNSIKAVREYNKKRHQERQQMREHDEQERQNAPTPPKRYKTENVPNGNRY